MPQIPVGHNGVVLRTLRSVTFFAILLNTLFCISVFYVTHFKLLVLFSLVTARNFSTVSRRLCVKVKNY